MDAITFDCPEAWPALLVVLATWIVLAWRSRRRQREREARYGERRAELTREVHGGRRKWAVRAIPLAFACLVLGWMGPRFGLREHDLEPSGVDLMFVLDVSRSMWARDVEPSRLERAKSEIRELVERYPGDRHALLIFAGEARLACPFTRDRRTFLALLDRASPEDVPRGGTDLGRALRLARSLVTAGESAHAVCCLLTDGEDHAGEGRAAALLLQRAGVALHVVGLGSREGAKIPIDDGERMRYLLDDRGNEVVTRLSTESLERMAEAVEGEFVEVSATRRPLLSLYERRIEPVSRRAFEQRLEALREPRHGWPLGLAFLLFLSALTFTDRRS